MAWRYRGPIEDQLRCVGLPPLLDPGVEKLSNARELIAQICLMLPWFDGRSCKDAKMKELIHSGVPKSSKYSTEVSQPFFR